MVGCQTLNLEMKVRILLPELLSKQDKSMSSNKQFTIRLASGKEQAFESAAAMVQWIEHQRGLESPRRRHPRRRRKAQLASKQSAFGQQPPLARYAQRRG